MNTNNIEVKISIPFPLNKPDNNGNIYFKGGQYYNEQDRLMIRVNREYGISYSITIHGQEISSNLTNFQYTTETMPRTIANEKGFRIRVRS